MINVGDRIVIAKGCKAREIAKHVLARVVSVELLGTDYSHACKVSFRLINGTRANEITNWYARHPNRLADPLIHLNDGNPLHTLEIRKVMTEKFSVCQFFEDGSYEYVRRYVLIAEAVEAFKHYDQRRRAVGHDWPGDHYGR